MLQQQLESFVQTSVHVGLDPAHVQAAGGNTSLKTDDQSMLVKASGTRLKEMRANHGHVQVTYPGLRDYYQALSADQGYGESVAATTLLKQSVTGGFGRPSMETGFHALLGTAVLHTHPVIPNIINCAADGASLFQKLLSSLGVDWHWIPYRLPGHELTYEIAQSLKSAKTDRSETVLFLQNHGLIVSANDLASAAALYQGVIDQTRHFLEAVSGQELTHVHTPEADPADYFGPQRQYLTPDEVIFCPNFEHNPYAKTDVHEVAQSIIWILEAQEKLGLKPCYLQQAEADRILNMESEKYRQALGRQAN